MENDITEEMWEEIENPITKQQKVSENPPESAIVAIPAHKPTAIAKQIRIEEVADLLLKLKSNTEIKKIISEKYSISPETVRNDICEASRLIQEQVPEIKTVIARNLESYRRIAEESEKDDKRTTLLALNSIEKLLRLNGPDVQNNTQINNLIFDSVDTQSLIELIKQLSTGKG
jgi:uncharacterized protein YktB (UPF0637 family)